MTVAPEIARFRTRFVRAIANLNVRLDERQVAQLSDVFRTVSWKFLDLDLQLFLVIDGTPGRLQVRGEPGEQPMIQLSMDSGLLDGGVHGKLSFVGAFLSGRLRVAGANPLQLMRFIHLLSPFLESYREAMESADVGT